MLPGVTRTHTRAQAAQLEQRRLDNKVRFIQGVVDGSLRVSNRKRADIERELEAKGFDRMAPRGAKVGGWAR